MKSFLVLLFTSAVLHVAAQNPGSLKLCGSVGFAQPLQSGVSGGFLLAIEPKIIVTPTIDVGVLVEAAYIPRSISFAGSAYPTNIKVYGSYKVTGNYWLSQGKYRSFVGIGAGLYQRPKTDPVTVIYNQSPDDILFPAGARFGGLVRYGLKTGHYVATVEYNAVLASTLYRSATPIKSQNSYLSIKVGYEIGGFKKKAATK